VPTELMR